VVPGYPSIGHVPYGFGDGLLDAYKAIRAASAIGVQSYFLGHSLGAAHAAELAGMWAADQSAIAQIVLCGCPKPGMVALSTLLASREVLITNLRNGRDPVPDAPVPLPPLLEWRDLTLFTVLNEPPDPNASQSSFEQLVPDATWHNIALYQKGAHALAT
jgi:pimeloyl-ACP methyl ester carboxylesterase